MGVELWGGVRVDVNEELKFCENSKKKMGGGEGVGGGEELGEGVWLGGQGGCERRIEVFGKIPSCPVHFGSKYIFLAQKYSKLMLKI